LSDNTSYVRLPHTLTADRTLTVASAPMDDAQFEAHQVDFIRHLFGYCAYLREHGRETPVSDAFLPVLVKLLEVLELNAPSEARQCAAQLTRIMQVTFPDLGALSRTVIASEMVESKSSDS